MKTIIIKQIIERFCCFEELSNRSFIEKRHAEYPEHIKSAAIEVKVMFNNCDKAICRNSRVYLDSDCIFGYSSKRFYVQVLLNPFEEQLYLPSVFIKQGNMLSLGCKAISKVRKSSLVFCRVVNNTSKKARIFLYRLLSCKPYSLIIKDIVRFFKQIFSVYDFILKLSPLSYYKVRTNKIDGKESCKVKITSAKDIVCIRFVRDLVHRIHIMNSRFRNIKECRDLSNNIIECMDFNPTLSLGKIATGYYRLAKSKMIGLRCVCSNNADKFSEAFTTGELAKNHNQQLIPAAERFNVFISLISHYNSLKCFLGKKFYELSKNIFSAVHGLFFFCSQK